MVKRIIMVGLPILMMYPFPGFPQNQDEQREAVQELNQDKKAFMETFKQEQKALDKGKDRDTVFMNTRPAIIPGSLLAFNKKKGVEALGISDPCRDSSQAFQMAKYRALAMAVLARKCSVEYVADYYTNETSTADYSSTKGVWEEFGRITASLNWHPGQVQILDSHYTRYEEGMVKVQLNQDDSHNIDTSLKKLKVKAEVYHVKNEVSEDWNNKWRYDLKVQVKANPTFKTAYTLNQTRQGTGITTLWKGQKDSLCTSYFHYQTKKNGVKDTIRRNLPNYSLNKGLWAAYVQGIFNKLLMATHKQAERLKDLDQSYNKNFQNLSRSVANKEFKMMIRNVKVLKNNRISLKAKFKEK